MVRTSLCFVAVLGLLVFCGSARATEMPISYWRFDEGSGLTAHDSVGANDGTLINGPVWTTGQVDGALSFDGIDDYVTSRTTGITNNQGTINAWVKYNAVGDNDDYVVATRTDAGGRLYLSYTRYGNHIVGLGSSHELNTGVAVDTSGWHHLTLVWNSGSYWWYYDGINNKSGTYSDTPDVQNEICIGCWTREDGTLRGGYFDGIIDEVAIYNKALTPEEIQQHYWNGLHGQGYLAIEVAVDIKPGSYPNAINLGSKGLIPVAILSSEDFNATGVDPDMVELAGADVAVRGKGNRFMAHEEDVNGDSLIDLVVQIASANLDPDSFQDGYAVLTGTTYGGLPIWGVDDIIIVPTQE